MFLKKYAVTVEPEVIQELFSTALHNVSVESESETVTEDSESEIKVLISTFLEMMTTYFYETLTRT